jgi:hypothetical protein
MRANSTPFLCLVVAALALACLGSPCTLSPGADRAPDPAAHGARMRLAERIYREGLLPSGEPLRAIRPGGGEVSGAAAACVMCHRRSGMGAVEGNRIIPPITGPFLHQTRARALAELDSRHTRGPDLAHALGRNRPRDAYTPGTLARAIREGIDPAGVPLEVLMPRYQLGDDDARLLTDYLAQLSTTVSPGVTPDTLHLGTVIAPGVSPARRQAMIDVLESFFRVRNAGAGLDERRDQAYPASAHNTYRRWELHVWELEGAPDTWAAQLAAFAQRRPVFALISGVSEGPWAPVQAFCEEQGLPCWFPTVDLPPAAATNVYTTYFSRGVLLEADLLADRLLETRATAGVQRLIQIRGADEAAAGAALATAKALAGSGVRLEERVLSTVDPAALRAATADAGSSDVVALWLRAPEVAQLAEVPCPQAPVYFSAILSGGERAPLTPAWKERARLLYPFELPVSRRASMTRVHAWLATHHLALVDERLEAEAYLACLLLSEKVDEMLENVYRDHLLERAEGILSLRLSTTMYRRLSLGPDQRFASKGGYIARFTGPGGDALAADGDWFVP